MIKHRLLPFFLQLPIARKIALVTALCSLLVALCLIIASYQGTRQLIQHSGELFGLSLAEQLARDASNPLVKNDKLSLQALLHKLIESPLVVRAAIYNVENYPIAEAGQQNAEGRALSASITFQDSIAGYAVLTLDTSTLQQDAFKLAWQLVFLALLLSMLGYLLSLFPARHLSSALRDLRALAGTPPSQRKPNTHISYAGEDELQALAQTLITGKPAETESPEPLPGNPHSALLFIDLKNYIALEAQYSTQQLSDWLQDIHQQLAMICKLYDAELSVERQHSFSLRFVDQDGDNSYPFRAVCAGRLLLEWQKNRTLPLSFSAGLVLGVEQAGQHPQASSKGWQQQLTEQQRINDAARLAEQGEGLFIAAEFYQHPSVQSRVLTTETNDLDFRVDGLTPRYSELLDHQLQALHATVTAR